MTDTVKLTGFKELDKALEKLTKAAGKGVLRRALKKAAQPVADVASRLAPDDPSTTSEDLHREIFVSPKLSNRDKAQHRKMFRDDKASVEMFIGPSVKAYPQALMQEFGTSRHGAQPYMRPAWDAGKDKVLDDIGGELWSEIDKAAARAARKAAKAGK
jgi:HK97 gp10 family phage protein